LITFWLSGVGHGHVGCIEETFKPHVEQSVYIVETLAFGGLPARGLYTPTTITHVACPNVVVERKFHKNFHDGTNRQSDSDSVSVGRILDTAGGI
jgi:hypothetical protein